MYIVDYLTPVTKENILFCSLIQIKYKMKNV